MSNYDSRLIPLKPKQLHVKLIETNSPSKSFSKSGGSDSIEAEKKVFVY